MGKKTTQYRLLKIHKSISRKVFLGAKVVGQVFEVRPKDQKRNRLAARLEIRRGDFSCPLS